MECDCWIGIINSYHQSEMNDLRISTINKRLQDLHSNSINLYDVGFSKKLFTELDYIDRRKGLSTLFNFCPYCGKKINWKKIREQIKEVMLMHD